MSRLIWSPRARGDLSTIDVFLMQYDPAVAARTLRSLQRAGSRLVDYPRRGRALSEPFRVIGVRDTPYLLIYRLRDGAVEIVRIRHGREDWLGPIEAEF